jgi:hypothetical protein
MSNKKPITPQPKLAQQCAANTRPETDCPKAQDMCIPSKPPSLIDKLQLERKNIAEKTERLKTALVERPDISPYQKDMLADQYQLIQRYEDILIRRIRDLQDVRPWQSSGGLNGAASNC